MVVVAQWSKQFALPSVHKGLILGIPACVTQAKIDSLGHRRRENMAQESEMHKTWPRTEFCTL